MAETSGVEATARAAPTAHEQTLLALAGSGGGFEDRFVVSLIRKLHRNFARLEDRGVDLETLGDPDDLAERVAASAPLEPSPLEELIGPFYDTRGLRTWLNTSRQALADRVRANTVLGLQTGDGAWVYPAWQFTGDRRPLRHLAAVLRALAAGTDERWTWALWLTAPNEDWDNLSAWQWLAAGRDPEPVLFEARADAARWAA